MRVTAHLWVAILYLYTWSEAADPKCTQGVQALLQPLKDYPPALSYCSGKYPLCKRAASSTTANAKKPSSSSKSSKTTSAVTTKSTTKSLNAKESLFSSLISEAGAVVSTFCSCLKPPKITTTTSPVKSTTTTTTSSAAPATSTACSADQRSYCDSLADYECSCAIDQDGVTPICYSSTTCTRNTAATPFCNTDADCLRSDDSTPNCVFLDSSENSACVGPTRCVDNNRCPPRPPFGDS